MGRWRDQRLARGRPWVPKQSGATLYGSYLLGVELASLLLLAGLVAAYHLARRGAVRKGGGR